MYFCKYFTQENAYNCLINKSALINETFSNFILFLCKISNISSIIKEEVFLIHNMSHYRLIYIFSLGIYTEKSDTYRSISENWNSSSQDYFVATAHP